MDFSDGKSSFLSHLPKDLCNRVFHNLDEIGNNANIGIEGFTS